MDEADTPDLTGAEVYVETAERPVAGGRWYVWPNTHKVIYQRPTGNFESKSMVAAHTLRSSASWTRVDPDTAAAE